jgi:hypothetical protein
MFCPFNADSASMRLWMSLAISWSLRGGGAGFVAAAGGGDG